jgi:phytoene desaturase
MAAVASKFGTIFHLNANVQQIEVEEGEAKSLLVNGKLEYFDGIIAAADYHHVESKLLSTALRNYDEKYWSKKTFAPSCLIYYLGVKKRIACTDIIIPYSLMNR